MDVLEFLMFKNVSGTHGLAQNICPLPRCKHLESYQEFGGRKERGCGRFHAAESMRSGTVSMLRKGLATLGLIGGWDPERAVGNPVSSTAVKQLSTYVERRTSKGGIRSNAETSSAPHEGGSGHGILATAPEDECMAYEPDIGPE